MSPARAPERCALSDLPPEQCACRTHTKPERQSHPLDDIANGFTAYYHGICPACETQINPGDLIVRTADGDYIHKDC